MRVAVVDDDASVRKALRRLLRTHAFDAETYGSGPELLDGLDTFRPDCIVLDLHMQGMTGLDLQRHLARIDCRAPTIMITGHHNPRARLEATQHGAGAYLEKPFDEEVLVSTIRRLIGGVASAGSA